jgi:hypothetical protein
MFQNGMNRLFSIFSIGIIRTVFGGQHRLPEKLNLTGRNQSARSSHVNRNSNLLLTNALLLSSAADGV